MPIDVSDGALNDWGNAMNKIERLENENARLRAELDVCGYVAKTNALRAQIQAMQEAGASLCDTIEAGLGEWEGVDPVYWPPHLVALAEVPTAIASFRALVSSPAPDAIDGIGKMVPLLIRARNALQGQGHNVFASGNYKLNCPLCSATELIDQAIWYATNPTKARALLRSEPREGERG